MHKPNVVLGRANRSIEWFFCLMIATMPPRNQCTGCSPQPYGVSVDGAYPFHSFPNIVHWEAHTQGKWEVPLEENLYIDSILATCPIATNGR